MRGIIKNSSGIFIDTDRNDYIVEYSYCKKYIRVINIMDNHESGWIKENSTSIRRIGNHLALHYRLPKKYKFKSSFFIRFLPPEFTK